MRYGKLWSFCEATDGHWFSNFYVRADFFANAI